MTIPERIRQGIKAKGISQAELARRTGQNPQDLQKILSGKVAFSKHFPTIAGELGVSVEWLTTGLGDAPSWAPQSEPTSWGSTDDEGDYSIPIIGAAAAAIGNRVEGHEEEGRLPIKGTWQAVVIRGSSGEPVVLPGQTVLVDPRLKAAKNRLVVVSTDDGAVLKRYVSQEGGKIFLASINAGVDSMVVDAGEREAWRTNQAVRLVDRVALVR